MSDLQQRLAGGDPEAWASAEAPLLLLAGALEAAQAQAGALACLERGAPPSPLLESLAQAWWQGCDAAALMELLGRLALRSPAGSSPHRRCALAAVLCARSASRAGAASAAQGYLAELERWAWGGAPTNLATIYSRAWAIRRACDDFASSAREPGPALDASAAIAAYHAADVAYAPYAPISALFGPEVRRLPSAARSAASFAAAAQGDIESADRMLRQLLPALLRSAMPACPLLLADG